jgi:hypothetical protein
MRSSRRTDDDPRFHRFLWTDWAFGMVDDTDFEFAIWAGGGNAVFPDKGRNHAPLDKVFVGIDVADERLAAAVLRGPFEGCFSSGCPIPYLG